MRGRIEIGIPILTDNMPIAFYKWFNEIHEKYEFCTMEVRNGEIIIVRVKTPVKGIEVVEHLQYGKITVDEMGVFLERTFSASNKHA